MRWEASAGAARVAAIFDAVRDALTTLPVYVGEFGLDVHRSFESGTTDEIGWLRCASLFSPFPVFSFHPSHPAPSRPFPLTRPTLSPPSSRSTVRRFAQERSFAFALWTYYTSAQGIVTERDSWARLQEWDCSPLAAAVFNFSRRADGSTSCGGLLPFSSGVDTTENGYYDGYGYSCAQ